MYPRHETHLSIGEITEEWAAELRPVPGMEDRVRNKLVQAFWEGNLGVQPSDKYEINESARVTYLHACRSLKGGHPGIVFVDSQSDIPADRLRVIDGKIVFDDEKYVVWSALDGMRQERFEAACRVLATARFEDYSDLIKPGLCAFVVSREAFAQLCQDYGWTLPTFWFAKGSRKTLSSAVFRCRRWFKAQAAGPKQMRKEDCLKFCVQEFPGLSKKQFAEIWDKNAAPAWRRPGRPRKGRWKSDPDAT